MLYFICLFRCLIKAAAQMDAAHVVVPLVSTSPRRVSPACFPSIFCYILFFQSLFGLFPFLFWRLFFVFSMYVGLYMKKQGQQGGRGLNTAVNLGILVDPLPCHSPCGSSSDWPPFITTEMTICMITLTSPLSHAHCVPAALGFITYETSICTEHFWDFYNCQAVVLNQLWRRGSHLSVFISKSAIFSKYSQIIQTLRGLSKEAGW